MAYNVLNSEIKVVTNLLTARVIVTIKCANLLSVCLLCNLLNPLNSTTRKFASYTTSLINQFVEVELI